MYAFNFDIISNVIASEWTRRQLWRNLGVVHKVINYAVSSKGNGETMKNMFFFNHPQKKNSTKKIVSLTWKRKNNFFTLNQKVNEFVKIWIRKNSIISRMTYSLVKWEKENQKSLKSWKFLQKSFLERKKNLPF